MIAGQEALEYKHKTSYLNTIDNGRVLVDSSLVQLGESQCGERLLDIISASDTAANQLYDVQLCWNRHCEQLR
jgi:hypothetical protein